MDIHLHQPHTESQLKSTDFLRDIVIGMSDGLTVPFALAAGLSGAVSNSTIIAIAGIAAICAGSIAMGLGSYLSGKSEQDHYKNGLLREIEGVDTKRVVEFAETREFFANIGLSPEVQEQATKEIARDKERWVNFMMKYELGLEKPEPKRAKKSAFNIGLSYVVGGIIPLSPYIFISGSMEALEISVVATLCCLFIFGYFKSRVIGINPWMGALRLTLIGAIAAAAAFGVAKLFGMN